MNKKGEMGNLGFGLILSAFIGILIGLILISSSAADVAKATDEYTTGATYTITAPTSGSWKDIRGQELLSVPTVTNSSGDAVAAGNYTIEERVSSVDGLKRIAYKNNNAAYNAAVVNVSYTYGMEGYIDDSGGRSIADLIIIFFALGIAAIALVPSLRSGVLGALGR